MNWGKNWDTPAVWPEPKPEAVEVITPLRPPGFSFQQAVDKAVEKLKFNNNLPLTTIDKCVAYQERLVENITKSAQLILSLLPQSAELTVNINRKHTVRGTKVGDLLVHESVDAWGEWQVSHVPTLVSFMKAIPSGKWSHDQLVAWCGKVQADLRDDWERLAKLDYDSYLDVDDRAHYAKERIRKHCLGTPVNGTPDKW